MKPLAIALVLCGSAFAWPHRSPIRCRLIATTKAKMSIGPWRNGAAGCAAVRKDAEFAARIFDSVLYKLQVQSAGENIFVRLDMTDGEENAPVPKTGHKSD